MSEPHDDHLRKLAEAAAESQIDDQWYGPDSPALEHVLLDGHAEFIAAANPQAIIRLLDERDRLQRILSASEDEALELRAAASEALAALREEDPADAIDTLATAIGAKETL